MVLCYIFFYNFFFFFCLYKQYTRVAVLVWTWILYIGVNERKKILICCNQISYIYLERKGRRRPQRRLQWNTFTEFFTLSGIIIIICIIILDTYIICMYIFHTATQSTYYNIATRACFSITHNQSGIFFDWEINKKKKVDLRLMVTYADTYSHIMSTQCVWRES